MKAPDKIYIFPTQNPADGWIGIAWRDKHGEMTEYIRKDALLEWAKRERVVGSDCKSCDGWAYAFSTMIEKLQIM